MASVTTVAQRDARRAAALPRPAAGRITSGSARGGHRRRLGASGNGRLSSGIGIFGAIGGGGLGGGAAAESRRAEGDRGVAPNDHRLTFGRRIDGGEPLRYNLLVEGRSRAPRPAGASATRRRLKEK